ncbi:unnamed protein product [Nippostrongylus brasiliensis]|uniref:Uncoordinated protein 79 (inferred by orthology to a C. elegans protein) n=1 Tax=Nippostrongylus brasiliensis TaxID=27835 RepID=A0A158R2U7_NIPBR|nr:unnamed protein product [Nippostrongylus brasiliensis]
MCLLFNRVVDMENPERHTVYLVISLFVSFLRKSVVCNAFISGLPEILDCNLVIGNQLLPTVVQLLLHLPSPQKLASDQHLSNYSLKLLSQHSRHLWLNSLILILYKYRFDQVPISDGVMRLINIVAKTLQGQAHVCTETDQPTDIATWDDISDEESESPKGMIRPESLTVTTIQVTVGQIFHVQEHEGEMTLHPTIVEPRMRKRSDAVRRKDQRKPRKPTTKYVATVIAEYRITTSLTSFDEETISLCLIAVETFLHREPVMAAPILFSLLHTVTRFQIASEGSSKPSRSELESAIVVMTHVLKVQNFSAFKSAVSLVDSFCKWLAEALHECPVKLESLLTVCTACNRALIRERDKQSISRAVVAEMIQAIKFKCPMHESNYISIANMILQDAGEDIEINLPDDQFNTAASEAVRPFLFEILDFIADLHVLAKLKAAPGAFADSVTNVRVLSWLLLGALHANHGCLPVPIECSQHMADYIHFVLAGFADQSKQSVVHMSALFHAFHLCQLWTVYCERAAIFSSTTAFPHLLDFWARVTPAILQLLSHSKVLADMVNLHFLNTIQALQQVNSALLCQLYPMWAPILTAYHSQIPNQLRIKLDSCENQPSLAPPPLSDWLKKVRYKISQVELQTSAASPYYNV